MSTICIAEVVESPRDSPIAIQNKARNYKTLAESDVHLIGGYWKVLEFLNCPVKSRIVKMPSENIGSEDSPFQLDFRQLLKGKLFLLIQDHTGAVREMLPISSQSDRIVTFFRQHLASLTEKDSLIEMDRLGKVIQDSRRTEYDRVGAIRTLQAIDNRDQRVPGKETSHARYKDILASLVRYWPNSPQIQLHLLMSVNFGNAVDIKPNSPDAVLFSALLKVAIDSSDKHLVETAMERLYYCNIQSTSVNGKRAAVFYPQIIAALEAREIADRNSGEEHSIATHTLANLALVHKGSIEEAHRNGPVVVHNVPLIRLGMAGLSRR